MDIFTAQLKEQAGQIQRVSAQIQAKQTCTENRRERRLSRQ